MDTLYRFYFDYSDLGVILIFSVVILIQLLVIKLYNSDVVKDTVLDIGEETVIDKIGMPKTARREMAILYLCVTVVMLFVFLVTTFRDKIGVYKRLYTDDYITVSGEVHNFKSGEERGEESFYIGDVEFSYEEGQGMGYHTFKRDGGVITGDEQKLTVGYIPYKGKKL
jgi:hypothetical protein